MAQEIKYPLEGEKTKYVGIAIVDTDYFYPDKCAILLREIKIFKNRGTNLTRNFIL